MDQPVYERIFSIPEDIFFNYFFQITDCYSAIYFDESKEFRRNYLERYCFTCKCQACVNNWPIATYAPKALIDIPDNQLKFSTDDPVIMQRVFDKINKIGSKIALEQKQQKFELVLALCLEFSKALKESIKPPHNFYVMAFRTFYKCNWIVKGSKTTAADLWIWDILARLQKKMTGLILTTN